MVLSSLIQLPKQLSQIKPLQADFNLPVVLLILVATGLTWLATFLYAKIWRIGSRVYLAWRTSSTNGVATICILGAVCAVENEKAHYNVCDMLSQTATRKARDFSRPWNGQGVMAMQWRLEWLQGSWIVIWTSLSSSSFLRWTWHCHGWPSRMWYGASGITNAWTQVFIPSTLTLSISIHPGISWIPLLAVCICILTCEFILAWDAFQISLHMTTIFKPSSRRTSSSWTPFRATLSSHSGVEYSIWGGAIAAESLLMAVIVGIWWVQV